MRAFSGFVLIMAVFLLQTVCSLLSAQSTGSLEETVINSVTSEPVPFATIKLKSNQLSIYSNSDGTFYLNPDSDFQSDSIVITCIGYKRYTKAVKDLIDVESEKIYLAPSKFSQENVKVAAGNAKLNSVEIIRQAIGSLNNRYPVKPCQYISYYRDYQKKDSNDINLNESIIQTYDSGLASGSGSNIYRLLDVRKNVNFPRRIFYSAYELPDSADLYSNDKLIREDITEDQSLSKLLTLMAYDPIRNFKLRSFSFIEIFSENFIENHNFSPPSEVYNDNLVLYRIAFNGKTRIIGDSMLVSGAIYIQPDDYSIHKLEYSCYHHTYKNGLKKIFDFNVEYGTDSAPDSLMQLKYISLCKLFTVIDADDKSDFRLTNYNWDILSNLNPTLSLSFNNKPDPVIASNKENYTIKFREKEIIINSIQVVGENIFLRFKDNAVKGITDSIDVYVRVLKDINGNVLNKRKSEEIYQFRELFVQEFNKQGIFKDSRNLQYLSAGNDTISNSERKMKYWMNSPKAR
jgi:hypothetical protein